MSHPSTPHRAGHTGVREEGSSGGQFIKSELWSPFSLGLAAAGPPVVGGCDTPLPRLLRDENVIPRLLIKKRPAQCLCIGDAQ